MPAAFDAIQQTPDEMEAAVGERLRTLRLSRNLDQQTVAKRAGIGLTALKRLEGGQGSTLHTLVCVLRALDRASWLDTIAPVATVNPLTLTRAAEPRQRARRRKPPTAP